MTLDIRNKTPEQVQLPVAYSCPHCDSVKYIRNGINKGIQRYKCKTCNRTFKDTTDTPLHGLHKKDKIGKYLDALREGMSIRKAAKYVGVSKNTAFVWRHKLLSSLNDCPKTKETRSVAGMAILRTPYSAKGRKKEPEKHQGQSKTILIITSSGLTIKKLEGNVVKDALKVITSSISKGNVATASDILLTKALKKQEIITYINISKQAEIYKEKVTSYIDEIEDWMHRFRGVASKYLQHYWSWYAAMHISGLYKEDVQCFYRWAVGTRSLTCFRETLLK